MAEQKKTRTRAAAKPKKVAAKAASAEVKPEVKEATPVDPDKLTKAGRQRYRELSAERGRIDNRIKQALKLRTQLDAIDKEIASLK